MCLCDILSGMKWKVLNNKTPSVKDGPEKISSKLLVNRGITTKKQRDEFFKPTHPSKLDLLNKTQVKKALDRIKKAQKKKETVLVYGDYDADGVCATAIMWEVLDSIGIKAIPYIPDRFNDGYGIRYKRIEAFKEINKKIGLVVTVDNGIVANDEIKKIVKSGIDVIVTDHHQKGKTVPRCEAVIHTTKVAGSAIAWLLAQEIAKRFKLKPADLKLGDGLELAGIGTISDIMPLVFENRSFAWHGLIALQNTKRPGLKQLFREAAIVPENIGSYEVGYLIAPRLNAMGRLADGMDSLRLICTRSNSNALKLADILGKTNKERQQVVEQVYEHALGKADELKDSPIIILAHEEYHEGVVGLAASRLVEKFYKPSIVIYKGKTISKASARSVSGFSIIEALRIHEDVLETVGGHTMAAGFSIRTELLDDFTNQLVKTVESQITEEQLQKKLKIDMPLSFSSINFELIRKLEEFEPTGIGNPRPTFITKKVKVFEAKAIGKENKHLKLVLSKSNEIFPAIAFGMGELATKLAKDDLIEIAYTPDLNIWNGNTEIQLKVKDVR